MATQMERKIERICSPINIEPSANNTLIRGHLTIKSGRYEETKDVVMSGIEDQIRFSMSVFGFGSSSDYWKMNVYEFYRDFVKAYEVNKDRMKKIKDNG